VVVVSPLYGLPVPWSPIAELASRHGAVLVMDAAQGFGARWQDRPLASLGDMAVVSFGRGKGWTAGRGGAALLSESFAKELQGPSPMDAFLAELSVVAGSAAHWVLGRPRLYGIPARIPWLGLGETRYQPPRKPRALTSAGAALALALRDVSEREVPVRVRTARALLVRLAEVGSLRPAGLHTDPGAAFLRLPLLGEKGVHGFRDPEAARAAGIMPSYPLPLPRLPVLSGRTRANDPYPGAQQLCDQLFTLPTHSLLTPADFEMLIAQVEAYGK
jgi:perosamine synthetase